MAFLIALGFTFSLASAQERDPAALPLNIKPPQKPRPFTLGLRETYYLADESTLLGKKHFEEVTIRIRGQGQADYISAGIDIGASYGINVPDYLSIFAPEAYFRFLLSETPDSSSPVATFGRKKDRWSLLDSYWELGTWQPLYRWDYLRPEEQGLIGAFLEIPIKEARLLFFATPLYVPESGPAYKIRNNKLYSDNPWFFEPTEQLVVINEISGVTDVKYDPHIPPIEEIVLNGAVGGSFEIGARTAGSWFRASYVYKPRNQLALPIEGKLQLTGTEKYIDVDIFPKVLYQNLFAADLGYKDETFSVWIATLYDQPIKESYTPAMTYQTLEPSFFFSPGIEYSEISDNGIGIGVIVSYLSKRGEDSSEVGPYASKTNPIFTNPYFFQSALRGEVRFSFPTGQGLRSSTGLALTQSFADDASWLKLVSEWSFTDRLRTHLEADFLGSLASRENNHFLSRYRGNDRILASGTYIF